MAGRSTARRAETGRSHPARPATRGWAEPVLPGARSGPPGLAEAPGVLTLSLSPGRAEPAGEAVPAVVVMPEPSSAAAAPDVVIAPPRKSEGEVAAPLPVVETDLSRRGCPHPVMARVSLSVVASMLLHAGAAAAFVWLSWTMPPPISAGEGGIPVELVVAADTGAASLQEAASGLEETQTPSTDSQAVQKVEAPPVETPPELAGLEPAETPSEEPPAAQPDPMTAADRIVDQLPPPSMPDHLPVIDRPAEPVLADTRSAPVMDEPVEQPQVQPAPAPEPTPVSEARQPVVQAEAAQPAVPVETAQKVETEAPTEVQAAVAPQLVETPPPAPIVQPPPPQVAPTPPVQSVQHPRPPARREATRSPTRREAPTTRERRRPTRPAAAVPQPERPVRAARQVESRASVAQRGEGAGQRNRQQSNATGASGASNIAAVAAWRQRVLAHLARYKVYPESARERGIRGRTGIAFTLTGSGAVASVSIASSSGAPILDQATLAMVRRAQPFPPNPAGGSASFTAGVNYNLH